MVAALSALVTIWLDLRRRRLPLFSLSKSFSLLYFDILVTGLAVGLAIWNAASFPFESARETPVHALAAVLLVAMSIFLWGEGRRAAQFQRPAGIVVGEFLVLIGFVRILVRSFAERRLIVGFAAPACILAGGLFLAWAVSRFLKKKEEHHILDRMEVQGETQQPEYTPATPECPHPERWTMQDSMSAELEILEFLKQLVLTIKPELIVETGTFVGVSAIHMAEAIRTNGFGRIITCEFDERVYAKAKQRIDASGVGRFIDCRNQSSLEMTVDGTIDLFFSDSHLPIREAEIRRFLPQISPNGLILMHDTSSHYKIAREAAFRLEQEGLLSMVLLPTPRGLMIAQKRSGRQ